MKSTQESSHQNEDCPTSFNVVGLQFIRNILNTGPFFPERSTLQGDIKELLDICVTSAHLQSELNSVSKKRIWQRETLSSVVNNIFMEPFEGTALDTVDHHVSGSVMSTTPSWFCHMGKQDCRNFFATSAAVHLPSNSLLKLKLMILFRS
jgi:hypothetical protein